LLAECLQAVLLQQVTRMLECADHRMQGYKLSFQGCIVRGVLHDGTTFLFPKGLGRVAWLLQIVVLLMNE
jgi:hypothetical protein